MDPSVLNNRPPDEKIGWEVLVTLSVTFFFVIATLCMRLYTRIRVSNTTGWDDYIVTLATACSLINLIFNASHIHWGGGRHAVYLNQKQFLEATKYSNLAMIPFVFCTALTKISIAFTVLRLTNVKWMMYYMYLLMGSLVLINGASLVVIFSFCRPSHAFWDVATPHRKCWNTKVLTTASNIQGAWSIVTDVICTSIPLTMVWKLKMATNQKIAVTVLVGFGLVTTVCSIGRVIKYAHEDFSKDATYTSIPTTIWTVLEENFGLVSSNLPSLGRLLTNVRERIVKSSSIQYMLSRSPKTTKSSSQGYKYPSNETKANKLSESEIEMIGVSTSPRKPGQSSGNRSLDQDYAVFEAENVNGYVRKA